jgi:hypothetical protein
MNLKSSRLWSPALQKDGNRTQLILPLGSIPGAGGEPLGNMMTGAARSGRSAGTSRTCSPPAQLTLVSSRSAGFSATPCMVKRCTRQRFNREASPSGRSWRFLKTTPRISRTSAHAACISPVPYGVRLTGVLAFDDHGHGFRSPRSGRESVTTVGSAGERTPPDRLLKGQRGRYARRTACQQPWRSDQL